MATENPLANTVYFGFSCSKIKNEVGDPHFLLLENNQHVAFKLFANLKKVLRSRFRATLIFQKIKMLISFQQ